METISYVLSTEFIVLFNAVASKLLLLYLVFNHKSCRNTAYQTEQD